MARQRSAIATTTKHTRASAAVAVDGRLVDYPIATKARWVLKRAGV